MPKKSIGCFLMPPHILTECVQNLHPMIICTNVWAIFEWQTKYFDEWTEREINNCEMWELVCVGVCGVQIVDIWECTLYNNVIFTLYLCKYAFRVLKSDICNAIHPNTCKRNDTITKLLSYSRSPSPSRSVFMNAYCINDFHLIETYINAFIHECIYPRLNVQAEFV